jgi:transcription elongation factor GreA
VKKQFRLTTDGVSELKTELEQLKAQREPIAQRIKEAREFGDLSENAEYSSARQEQERTESRISEIENILLNVEIIAKNGHSKKVLIGSKVGLRADGKIKEFQVVGTVEADPINGKISDESPIGQALLGKKVGDDVEIVTPSETSTYKITEIA